MNPSLSLIPISTHYNFSVTSFFFYWDSPFFSQCQGQPDVPFCLLISMGYYTPRCSMALLTSLLVSLLALLLVLMIVVFRSPGCRFTDLTPGQSAVSISLTSRIVGATTFPCYLCVVP